MFRVLEKRASDQIFLRLKHAVSSPQVCYVYDPRRASFLFKGASFPYPVGMRRVVTWDSFASDYIVMKIAALGRRGTEF